MRARLRGFCADLRLGWRRMNGWLKVGILWILTCQIASLTAIEIHARTPGDYHGPRKVAVRKTIAGANLLGVILFFCVGLPLAVKRAADNKTGDAGPSDAA